MNSNTQTPETSDIVIDVAKSSISDLWTKEDYWAIWLGFLLLIFGMFIYFPNPPADMEKHAPAAGRASYWNFNGAPHGGGSDYLVKVAVRGETSASSFSIIL